MVKYRRLLHGGGKASDIGLTSSNIRNDINGVPLTFPILISTLYPNRRMSVEVRRLVLKRKNIDIRVIIESEGSEFEFCDISTFWGAEDSSAHMVELYYPVIVETRTGSDGSLRIGRVDLWVNNPAQINNAYISFELQGDLELEDVEF